MSERKLNCWEVKRCGRQPQGRHVHDKGVCPAAIEEGLDGVHDGTNAGRACWVVGGTLCRDEVQGTFAQKFRSCEVCDFYQQVKQDEFPNFILAVMLLGRLRNRAR